MSSFSSKAESFQPSADLSSLKLGETVLAKFRFNRDDSSASWLFKNTAEHMAARPGSALNSHVWGGVFKGKPLGVDAGKADCFRTDWTGHACIADLITFDQLSSTLTDSLSEIDSELIAVRLFIRIFILTTTPTLIYYYKKTNGAWAGGCSAKIDTSYSGLVCREDGRIVNAKLIIFDDGQPFGVNF